MTSTIESTGKLNLTPADWISDIPANWGAAGIEGTVSEAQDGTYIDGRPSGPGTSACEDFRIERLEGLKG